VVSDCVKGNALRAESVALDGSWFVHVENVGASR
jgi:hypothetical protein